MKIIWRHFLHRLASVVIFCVCGVTAWHSAICYAASAYDDASDPVYSDGWQAGDNGGTGFTAWNFDSSYFWPGDGNWYPYTDAEFHAIDDGLQGGTQYSNPFNSIGRSWALGVSEENINSENGGPPRAGRGFDPLQIGQSIRVVFDNPTDRQFFKGYFIQLNSTFDTDINGDPINGNNCNGAGANCTPNGTPPDRKMYLSRFEYFDDGEWGIVDADNPGPPVSDYTPTGVFDTDTAAAGALFQVTRTGEDTYDVLLDPFGPGSSYTLSETFANPGSPVNWIQFTFFNTLTDNGAPPAFATDLYIRSIEITDAPGASADFDGDGDVDGRDFLVWQRGGSPDPLSAEDLELWQDQYGSNPLAAITTIPEPTCFTLVVLGGVSALSQGLFRKR